ncbi:unnamed protein product [Lactuca virosa]|uniref:HTH myb-type domain-containing protein n=1 Tax=Lactuca virosa TaxID=75947 RepID=A0AAU9PCP0_9ASTR|nr:unnamed protein product [Lactuca virosa]
MSTTNSFGRSTQSIRAKDICILLVNDDHVCCNIVSNMLDHCRYEVFSYEKEMDALSIIREKKDTLEIILTNVHRTYAKKYGIIDHIEKEFKLQIILMSPDVDDIKKVSEGGGNGVTVYILKSLSVKEVNNLWANAMAQEKSKREISSSSGKSGDKRKIETDEENGNVEKKTRIVWTKEMHQKFLDAIDQLGNDKVVPKKIAELMNVPGLTRENVASHLQKYRICMKRAQGVFTSSSYDFTDPFNFNPSQANSQESHWNPFPIRSRNTTPSLFSLNCYESRLRTFPNMPLLSKIQLKPDRSFRVCGNEKKNILLSIEDNNRICSDSSFAGFRLANDGKSIQFGQNGHFDDGGVNKSYIQQHDFCPEMGNDDSTLGPERDDWMSSVASLLGVDDNLPSILTQQQPPTLSHQNKVAATTMTQPPPSVGLQWSDWAEPPGFSPQQPPPPPGNEVNDNFEIFSDFISPGLCELGKGIDENGVDATGICGFDDLLFNNQDLT